MNYYDDILNKIYSLIVSEDYEQAKSLIITELNMAYVPKDTEKKLNEYLSLINERTYKVKAVSDDEIEKYLEMDENHQLLAVNELNQKNLRDYTDLVNKYLCSDGYKNAKVLLIDSLIRQEIGDEIHYNDNGMEYTFIPKYILPLEQADGFILAQKLINEEFMKNPSENKIALQLLYKEGMMRLPINIDASEGQIVAMNIITYVYKAFNDEEGIDKYSENEVLN